MPISKDKKEVAKKEKSILSRIIISLIFALVATLLLIFKFNNLGINLSEIAPSWGKFSIYSVIFLGLFALSLSLSFIVKWKEKYDEEKKQLDNSDEKKQSYLHLWFLGISFVSTIVYLLVNRQEIFTYNFGKILLYSAAFFGAIFVILEILSYSLKLLKRLPELFINLITGVAIPSLVLIIILLGALSSKYHFQDTFIQDASGNITSAVNIVMSGPTINDTLVKVYSLGQNNPTLWIYLCIVGFLVLILYALRNTFDEDEIPDEEKPAQQILDEVTKREQEDEKEEDRDYYLKGFFEKIDKWFKSLNEKLEGPKAKKKREAEEAEEKKQTVKVFKLKLTEIGNRKVYKDRCLDDKINKR